MAGTLAYLTRDGEGNDVEKAVEVKRFKAVAAEGECPICGERFSEAVRVRDAVSDNFTDWPYVGDYVCERCSACFSLYKYSYVLDPGGIRLLNVRQIRGELEREQRTPFKFVISTSQKKHLFYRAPTNYSPDRFSVCLETEAICTTRERMSALFDLVEGLRALGQGRDALREGDVRPDILKKVGFGLLDVLGRELSGSREIQIPLFCGQKAEKSEEEAICSINSALTTLRGQGRP